MFYLCRSTFTDEEPKSKPRKSLLEKFQLTSQYEKLCTGVKLPKSYSHFISELRMPNENHQVVQSLAEIAKSTSFERPIEIFSEDKLKSAFELDVRPLVKKDELEMEQHVEGKHFMTSDQAKKRDKKEKRKKKRDRENNDDRDGVFKVLLKEMREMTWMDWVVDGKAGNPFIQKITRDNCQALGVGNYFDYIETAMDITRMEEKLNGNVYEHVDEFKKDVSLIVDNAKLYNRIGEPVHRMAMELDAKFHERLNVLVSQVQLDRKRARKMKKKKVKPQS